MRHYAERFASRVGTPMRIATTMLLLALTLAAAANAGLPAPYLPPQRIGPSVTGDGAIGDQLGRAIAHQGTTLLIGARQTVLPAVDAGEGVQSGAAYVYLDTGTAFTAQQRLQAPDPGEDDLFGAALALDGDLLVVGAPGADRQMLVNRGSAYLFRRGPGGWTWEATLAPPDAAAHDNFGIALAVDAGTVLIGAPGRAVGDAAGAGSVFAFRQVAGTWTAVATITAPLPVTADRFGSALALNADRLLVGVPLADAAGGVQDAGAVDAFVVGAGFVFATRLVEPLPVAQSRFGSVLWMGAAQALVGAPGNTDTGSNRGFVRAFTRSANNWLAAERLVALDGAIADGFGSSIDGDGSSVLIGALSRVFGQGGGYVFTRVGGVLTQRARLEDFSEPEGGGLTGVGAALIGGRALLGADLATVLPNRAQGVVRVWRGSEATWTPEPRIDRGDGAAGDFFGFALAIDGPRLAVGSFLEDTAAGGDDAGTVSMFDRSNGSWTLRQKLEAPDGQPEDLFGRAVAIAGDLLVVGAPQDIFGIEVRARGSIYVFRRATDGQWAFERKLTAPDAQPDDGFGFALAFDGRRLLATAPGRDDGATDRGAAYAWSVLDDGSFRFDGKLLPASVPDFGLAGIGLALAGERAVLGAPEATVGGRAAQGMAVVFQWNGTSWVEASSVVAADGAQSDRFGGAVALERDGSPLAVGATGASADRDNRRTGAAYVFRIDSGAAVQEARLQAAIPEPGAGLGSAIDLRDGRLLVGASGEDTGGIVNVGRVHLWQRTGTGWTTRGTIEPVDATPFTFFGRSVATDVGTAVIGGPLRASLGPAEGSAWIYADSDRLGADGFE